MPVTCPRTTCALIVPSALTVISAPTWTISPATGGTPASFGSPNLPVTKGATAFSNTTGTCLATLFSVKLADEVICVGTVIVPVIVMLAGGVAPVPVPVAFRVPSMAIVPTMLQVAPEVLAATPVTLDPFPKRFGVAFSSRPSVGVTSESTAANVPVFGGGKTVRTVEPEMAPDVAMMVVVPAARAVALPFVPAALLMVAMAVSEELQVTAVVKSCVLLSEYVPVAVNCWNLPMAMLGFAGVTAMDCKVAGVTVRVVEPEISPDVAVMVVVPAAREVAVPFVPAALLMAALVVSEELQVTVVVRSCVLPSEKVPVAVNCWTVELTMLGFAGVTAMDSRVAGVTVSAVEPEMAPDVAMMVVVPAARAVALPFVPAALLMVALVASEELQVTAVVRSCVLLSEY